MTVGESQRTLAGPVTVAGSGLHSGAHAVARLLPGPPDHGVVFRRVDLADGPVVPARLSEVVETAFGVVLGRRVRVATVEHLLSAARGVGVDNLMVELHGEELPCGDGSAQVFVEAFHEAGVVDQGVPRSYITLDSTLTVGDGASLIAAVPSSRFHVTCVATVDRTSLPPQIAEYDAQIDDYAAAIAPARTWGLWEDEATLKARGLARGASLATALIIGPDGFLNAPRFPNELARHKILDAVGDLALLGRPLRAHVVAVRSGHGLHVALAREIARCLGHPTHA
jgi:UDP-3-O-acyl N-acetylglucosamine deacetylase